jgi:hypothetical protein
LIGGSGVTNVNASTAATPGTIDTGTDVTAPAFQPDLVIVGTTGAASNDTNSASANFSIGFATRAGANPHPQYSDVWRDTSGVTTTSVGTLLNTDMVGRDDTPGATAQEIELQDFDANGFTAMSRTLVGAETFGYIAIKVSGIGVKVQAVDSPTATGSANISSIGFTPQWGMLVQSASITNDTQMTDGNAEVFGMSMFDATTQACLGVSSDDAVGTTNVDTIFNTTPVCLRKDAGTFYAATFSSFGSGTATFNYGTANGTTRKWAGLFIEAGAVAGSNFGIQKRRAQ